MKKRMKRVTALLCTAALILGLTACSSKKNNDTPAGSAKRTDINLLVSDAFSTIDPHNLSLNADFVMSRQVYEPLFWFDDENNEIPLLGTEYTVSDDQLTWTIKLRENVSFHNGDTFTAEDVVYSLNRCMASAYMQNYTEAIDTVTAVDDFTVDITLTHPFAPLLQDLSRVGIVSKTYAEEHVDDQGLLGYNECGTGAYVYVESTPDVNVVLEAFPDYWDKEPSIKTLNFQFISDTTTALTAFKAGEIDLISLPPANVEEVASSDQFSTKEVTTNHVLYLIFNSESDVLKNKELRQAIASAVNRADIIDMAVDGAANPATSIATPYVFGYDEDHPFFDYDVERAKELLAEAGYPDGVDIGSIKTMAGSDFEKAAQAIQPQLEAIGITCQIEGMDGNGLVNDCITGNFEVAVMGQSLTRDYDFIKTYYNQDYIDGMNMARYVNPEVESLFAQGAATIDPDARMDIYRQIEEITQEDCVYLPLYNLTATYAWNKDLNCSPTISGTLYKNLSWK